MQANPEQRRAFLVFSLIVAILFAGAFHIQHPQPILTALVPHVAPPATKPRAVKMPNFAAIRDTAQKKQRFFDFLQPYVDQKNLEVQHQRQHLMGLIEKIRTGYLLSMDELVFLRNLSLEYEVPTDDLQDQTFLELLLRRVDVIPPSLVLAQAANESAWGTSRFAREGFNFFGQWCFEKGCGLVPDRRRPSDNHEVKSFASIEEAVHAYFRNLNTFPSYQGLRRIRQDLRDGAKPIDGLSLSEGLRSYSERGDAYIDELRRMIEYNGLLHRDEQVQTLY
ncbi:MAG: glucosaminidase domain-containing protein [Gammaproteobacteria bacterium]